MKTIKELKQESNLATVITDHQGFITFVNKSFENIFGWKSSEILGKPLTIIIPQTLQNAHHLGFSRFLATGQPTLINKPLKLKAVKKDGIEFESEHIIFAEQENGNWIFGATISPIT